MKNILALLFFVWSISGHAQLRSAGTPLSWLLSEEQLSSNIHFETLNPLNTEILLAQDQEEVNDKSAPYRFAYSHHVNYTTGNAGRWTNFSNGDRVWRMGITAPDAHAT